MVSSPNDDIIDSRMDNDIDSSRQEVEINFQSEIDGLDLAVEEESSYQKKRKQTQENATDEPMKIKTSQNK